MNGLGLLDALRCQWHGLVIRMRVILPRVSEKLDQVSFFVGHPDFLDEFFVADQHFASTDRLGAAGFECFSPRLNRKGTDEEP